MPRFILKAVPDRDAYIEWSTVVNAPVSIGTRGFFAAEFGEDRMARTDDHGTSAMFSGRPGPDQEGGWDDPTLLVMECSGILPRARLGDLYDLLASDINAKIPADWVTPFPDDDTTESETP